ncbi:Aste57867_7941 [Aphanomyces stellatus]|uniref:Aste57867_7941 protein n=1 Tax=Aphanomyces stellatus TaxID=120398 RepID=A0A485KJ15_9STRA|nr:hypothetical protein As57867_007911 [Aphanomyces stellatus]VFT84834.1 Aste57867_7941 [Aphanomyces stellatus]
MKSFVFALLAAVASFTAAQDQYITFENGIILSTYIVTENNTQTSVTTYDEQGYPEGGQIEGAIEDFGNDVKNLIDLVQSLFNTGFTPGKAQQIVQGLQKAAKDGYAAVNQVGDVVKKIQDMVKNGASLADSQFLLTAVQGILQDVLRLVDSQPVVCRRRTFGRGIGSIPSARCLENEEKILGLCYPTCKNEFESVLGFVCRKQGCGGVSGAKDLGISCTKPSGYGRGVGYFKEAKCTKENSQGCEKNGLLWYPKCQPGFHAFGCCICTPDCPSGAHDDGAFCRKESYFRAGTSRLECDDGKEKSLGLCYSSCGPNTDSFGPICAPQCKGDAPTRCGLFCTSTSAACAGAMVEVVGDGTRILLSAIAQDFTGVIKASIQLGKYIIMMRQC